MASAYSARCRAAANHVGGSRPAPPVLAMRDRDALQVPPLRCGPRRRRVGVNVRRAVQLQAVRPFLLVALDRRMVARRSGRTAAEPYPPRNGARLLATWAGVNGQMHSSGCPHVQQGVALRAVWVAGLSLLSCSGSGPQHSATDQSSASAGQPRRTSSLRASPESSAATVQRPAVVMNSQRKITARPLSQDDQACQVCGQACQVCRPGCQIRPGSCRL